MVLKVRASWAPYKTLTKKKNKWTYEEDWALVDFARMDPEFLIECEKIPYWSRIRQNHKHWTSAAKHIYSLRQNCWDIFVSSRPLNVGVHRIAINNIGREKGSTERPIALSVPTIFVRDLCQRGIWSIVTDNEINI